MERSVITVKKIFIQEFYSKDDKGDVYWNYRFNGGDWDKKLTPLKDIPCVTLDVKNLEDFWSKEK